MRFHFEQIVNHPLEEVFAFHENPERLRLMQPGEEIVLASTSGHIQVGARTVIRQRVLGIWFSMELEHYLYEPPNRFAEKVIRGLMFIDHIHEFDAVPEGTRVRDVLTIKLPWYCGGELGLWLFGAARVRALFRYRQEQLVRLLDEAADACGDGQR